AWTGYITCLLFAFSGSEPIACKRSRVCHIHLPLNAPQFQSLVAVLHGLLDGLLPRPVGTRQGGECQRVMKAFRCHPICTFLIYKCTGRACFTRGGFLCCPFGSAFVPVGAGVDEAWGGDAL